MRPSIVVGVLASIGLAAAPAAADSTTGGGRGPLGQVSSGIDHASGGGGSSQPAADTGPTWYGPSETDCGSTGYYCRDQVETVVIVDGDPTAPVVSGPRPRTRVEAYAGIEKVHDSDGAIALELSLVDRNFRLNGMLTHYFEDQMDGGRVTMTMPELTVGFRFGDLPMWLEGGVVNARTHDPMGSSSIIGPVVGTRIEHPLAPHATLFGTVEAMYFEHDIRAYGARVGLRLGRFQASLRLLDFNVGPALYGPEVGIRF